jgi:methionyl-tRNA formyltransferase
MKTTTPLKHLLFAEGYVGREIAKFLLASFPEDVLGVVTTSRNEIHDLASGANKLALVYEAGDSFVERLPGAVDLGILAWWPYIIRGKLLEVPRLGYVNTHPSLLPNNRGKNPNFWSIVEECPFGVTIHKLDANVDSGPIIAQRQISYDWSDTGGSIYKRALTEMVDLFEQTYTNIRENTLVASPQAPATGSFHLSKELDPASKIELDRLYSARKLLNLLRARTFDEYPACYFEDRGEEFEVRVSITKKRDRNE